MSYSCPSWGLAWPGYLLNGNEFLVPSTEGSPISFPIKCTPAVIVLNLRWTAPKAIYGHFFSNHTWKQEQCFYWEGLDPSMDEGQDRGDVEGMQWLWLLHCWTITCLYVQDIIGHRTELWWVNWIIHWHWQSHAVNEALESKLLGCIFFCCHFHVLGNIL